MRIGFESSLSNKQAVQMDHHWEVDSFLKVLAFIVLLENKRHTICTTLFEPKTRYCYLCASAFTPYAHMSAVRFTIAVFVMLVHGTNNISEHQHLLATGPHMPRRLLAHRPPNKRLRKSVYQPCSLFTQHTGKTPTLTCR
jgi:hypothetical protein